MAMFDADIIILYALATYAPPKLKEIREYRGHGLP